MSKTSKHLDNATWEILSGAEIRFGVREGLGNAYPEILPITDESEKGAGELPRGFTQRLWDSLTDEQRRDVVYGGRKKVENLICF